jgi:hypothetical protein
MANRGTGRFRRVAAIAAGAVAGAAIGGYGLGVRINTSYSLPMGGARLAERTKELRAWRDAHKGQSRNAA